MPMSVDVLPEDNELCLAVDKVQLIKAQQADSTLVTCLSAAQEQNDVTQPVSYLFDEGVLMRKWVPVSGRECDVVTQVVVPKDFRLQVLSIAHDHGMSGHLGIKKTIG